MASSKKKPKRGPLSDEDNLINERMPWERHPEESQTAFQGFVLYRDQPNRRSARKVAEALGKSENLISGWCHRYKWQDRALAWDDEQDRIVRQAHLEQIRTSAKRHATMGSLMQSLAIKKLQQMNKDGTPRMLIRDAAQFAMIGIKLEREALELERMRQDRARMTREAEKAILQDEMQRRQRQKSGVPIDPAQKPWAVTVIGAEGRDVTQVIKEAVHEYFDKPMVQLDNDDTSMLGIEDEEDD